MTLPGLFVVGTDTGVGKTLVAAGIARALARSGRRVGVLKPVATGAERTGDAWRCEDAEHLTAAAGVRPPLQKVVPLLFHEPLAPPVAARRAGLPLRHTRVVQAVGEALRWWGERADVMVVEGVGGLLCPLAEGTTVVDLAASLDLPLVIVARRGLGTLNHALMTVEAAHNRAIRIAGLVLNTPTPGDDGPAETTLAAELARRLPGVAILTELPYGTPPELSDRVGAVDWLGRVAPSRRTVVPATGAATVMPSGRSDQSPRAAPDPPRHDHPSDDPRPAPVELPAGSTSGDELSAILEQGRPDPMLGEFVEPPAAAAKASSAEKQAGAGDLFPEGRVLWPAATGAGGAASHGSFDPITGLGLERLATDAPRGGSSTDALAALGLDTGQPPVPGAGAPTPAVAPSTSESDDDDPPPRSLSWPVVLLASYASAVTIGLVWVLWTGRSLRGREPAPAEPPAFETRSVPGRRPDRNRVDLERPALTPGIVAALGQPVRLGQLEITPLSVSSGRVTLRRTLVAADTQDGGGNALKLHLRIRNVSTDRTVEPLDEAYLREREPGSPDSFIDTGPGHARIDPFPLAVESEWSIVGQDLRALKPGGSVETVIVSAPDAVAAMTPAMTWRVRLQTDIEHTEVLDVRFRAGDVRPDP